MPVKMRYVTTMGASTVCEYCAWVYDIPTSELTPIRDPDGLLCDFSNCANEAYYWFDVSERTDLRGYRDVEIELDRRIIENPKEMSLSHFRLKRRFYEWE